MYVNILAITNHILFWQELIPASLLRHISVFSTVLWVWAGAGGCWLLACVNIGTGHKNRFLEPGIVDMGLELERETEDTKDWMNIICHLGFGYGWRLRIVIAE